MPKPAPPPKPNVLRVWLKTTMESGAFERIPANYPLAAGGARDALEYARDLLAALRDPDTSPRPLHAIVADAVQFRDWVESRRQISRRIILAKSRPGEGFEAETTQAPRRTEERRPASEPPSARPAPPRSDPMWDEFLDGLDR